MTSTDRVMAHPSELGKALSATVPFHRRAAAFGRTVRDLFYPMKADRVTIKPVHGMRALGHGDIPLVALTHNDRRLLPAFLAHYRQLGVTRFILLDDASTDGTHSFLCEQTDVDLFTSNVRYKIAYRGRLWRQMLVEHYGIGRWYLFVDSDEFLVFRESDKFGLGALIAALERRGIYHLTALMLDMYPPGCVAEAKYDGTVMPWEVASLYDATGYTMTATSRCMKAEGGVRRRVFGSELQLMKSPLLYWGLLTSFTKSIHAPAPYWRNLRVPTGVLLHFKFFGDYAERFEAAVENGQHALDGASYSGILSQIADSRELVLQGELSASYSGPEDLYRRGFMADWAA